MIISGQKTHDGSNADHFTNISRVDGEPGVTIHYLLTAIMRKFWVHIIDSIFVEHVRVKTVIRTEPLIFQKA